MKKLQDAAAELQSSVPRVLASSKLLIGRLDSLAAGLVQSETGTLSCQVLLLSQAISETSKGLQVRTL